MGLGRYKVLAPNTLFHPSDDGQLITHSPILIVFVTSCDAFASTPFFYDSAPHITPSPSENKFMFKNYINMLADLVDVCQCDSHTFGLFIMYNYFDTVRLQSSLA